MATTTKYLEKWFKIVVGLKGEDLNPRTIKGVKVESYVKECVKIWGARCGHNGFMLKNKVKNMISMQEC